MSQNSDGVQSKKGLGSTQIILIAGFSVLIIGVVVTLVVLLGRGPEIIETTGDPLATEGNVVVTEDNIEDILNDMNSGSNIFYVEMNSVWQFPDAKTASSDAVMKNSDSNYEDMYITVVVNGADVIYKSPVMKPGSELKNIKLTQDLGPGTYDAIVVHHVLGEDGSETGNIQMAIQIVVLS